jgi:hypothetical protein
MTAVILYPRNIFFSPHRNIASDSQDTMQNSNIKCTLSFTRMPLLYIINIEKST